MKKGREKNTPLKTGSLSPLLRCTGRTASRASSTASATAAAAHTARTPASASGAASPALPAAQPPQPAAENKEYGRRQSRNDDHIRHFPSLPMLI